MKTTYNFFKRALEKHNNKYDYSESIYINNSTKMVIICPIHGRFLQTPCSHLKYGCKSCAKEKRIAINKNNFIKKAKTIHNNKYDYSRVNYKDKSTNVSIICPTHGMFYQKPKEHISGSGCQKCGLHKIGITNFIKRSIKKHNNKYDYSKVDFDVLSDEIVVICPKHGEFTQKASYHLRGHGCLYCCGLLPTEKNNLLVLNKELCAEWDYKKNDKNPDEFLPMSTKKVWWRCDFGHSWLATIGSRVAGARCPYCSCKNPTESYNLETEFPELCKEWSPNNENSPDLYTPHSNKKVMWKCKNGHEWEATVNCRTSREYGCPFCSKRISKASVVWLDKLGVKEREKKIVVDGSKFFVDGFRNNVVYEFLGDYWHANPNLYSPTDIHPTTNNEFGEILYNTISKLNIICQHYKVTYKWEQFEDEQEYGFIRYSKLQIVQKAKQIYQLPEAKDILLELME